MFACNTCDVQEQDFVAPIHIFQTWPLLPLLQLICTYVKLELLKHSLQLCRQSCIDAAFIALASTSFFSLAALPCRAISLQL